MTEHQSHPGETANAGTRVCVAAVAGAHGVKGLVRLKAFTEVPEDCTAYGPLSSADGSRTFRVELLGRHKALLLARIEGVGDRDRAEALRGTRLYVDRAALPEPEDNDEFYHADLIGLAAELRDGTRIGRVRAVYDFGAGDTLELGETADGKALLVPFTLAVVPEVDVAGGRLVVAPPPGLLSGDETVGDETAGSEAGGDASDGVPDA
ncbi:MAG: 16S rRNA processing protein RimM [Alphaproteobacteria bacterium]|nr:16S rRNA processing protein RimM [Alphaproteobacteria bacterium]MCB9928287.1 16S rRNA processing protein RimM [Alphaproteobacteria bacterium]